MGLMSQKVQTSYGAQISRTIMSQCNSKEPGDKQTVAETLCMVVMPAQNTKDLCRTIAAFFTKFMGGFDSEGGTSWPDFKEEWAVNPRFGH